jgi:hypothetical protein
MQKHVGVIILLLATSLNALAQKNLLPQTSNVYPDTFAIYWQFPDLPEKLKPDEIFITYIETIYGDRIQIKIKSFDTLAVSPFYSDWESEQALQTRGAYGKKDEGDGYKPARIYEDRRIGHRTTCLLRVTTTTPKIEALIELKQTRPNVTNLLLLANAYEEAECYVNALYIYKRIVLLNTEQGRKEWIAFYERTYKKFRWKDPEGAVNR